METRWDLCSLQGVVRAWRWAGSGKGERRGLEVGLFGRRGYLPCALRPVSRLDSGSAEEDGAAKKQSLYAASAPAMGAVVPAAAARAPTHRRPWRQVLAGEERARDGRQARARGGVPHGEDEPAMAEGPAGKKGMHGAGGEELLVQRRANPWSKGRRGLWAGGGLPFD